MDTPVDQVHFQATVSHEHFSHGIRQAQKLLDPKSPDRRCCIELAVHDDRLTVGAANRGSVGARWICEGEAFGKGHIMVEVKVLASAITALGADTVRLNLEPTEPDWLQLCEPEGFSISLPTSPGFDSHPWHAPKRGAVHGEVPAVFAKTLRTCALTACQDEKRINIHGVSIEHDGATATVVSTDGHRMSISRRRFNFRPFDPVTLPVDMCHVVPATPLDLRLTKDSVGFQSPTASLWARPGGGTFPPWRAVLPSAYREANERPNRLRVHREQFVAICRKFKKIFTGTSAPTRLYAEDNTLRFATSAGTQHVPIGAAAINVRTDGASWGTAVNPVYAADAARLVEGDYVYLSAEPDLGPVVFSSENYEQLGVIMPIREP